MSNLFFIRGAIGAFILSCAFIGSVASSHAEVGDSYERNALEDVDGHPKRSNGFEFLPRLRLVTEYVSNVFAEEDDEEADLVLTVQPELTLSKDYRDHEFNFSAAAAIVRYQDNKNENIENFNGAFFGVLTATNRLKLPFEVSYKTDHQLRNRERTLNGSDGPAKFSAFKGVVGAEYIPNRFEWKNYIRYEQRRFENLESLSGLKLVREDGDFDSLEFETRIGYKTAREWSPFLGLTIGNNDYLRGLFDGNDFNGVERDNSFVTVLGGVGFDVKDRLNGEIGIGQTYIDYDDQLIDDISTFALSGNLNWQLSDRTILSGELSRQIIEDNFVNTGIIETTGRLGLDYEIDRDLFLRSFVSVENDDFDESTREDTTYTGRAGLYYILNPRFQLEGAITHRIRDSNVDEAEFDQSVFMLGLTGAL